MITIKKGLNLPIHGTPKQEISKGNASSVVALVGTDYHGLKPSLNVQEGDQVKLGQLLFEDKKNPGVRYTSPAAGKIVHLNRGHRRVFQSIEIEVSGNEEQVAFAEFKNKDIASYTDKEVEALLNEAGLWGAIRKRPFSKTPALGSRPLAFFINAMDSNPLAANPDIIINEKSEHFQNGIKILSKLTSGPTFVIKRSGSKINVSASGNIKVEEFSGPHPAGNVGTHIHHLFPANEKRIVWYMGYQDVIAVGELFKTGKLSVERVVSLSGPMVKNPRLIRTRIGANCTQLTQGELVAGEARIISGSVLFGQKCWGPFSYLTRFSNQVTALQEGREREFLGWQAPGFNKFSVKRVYASCMNASKIFPFTSNKNGSPRAMVPVGAYEKVMPFDTLPTQLLRALITKNTELSQQLGCLELDEEDLALCTFVDPGKVDFGPILRDNLTQIEKEG